MPGHGIHDGGGALRAALSVGGVSNARVASVVALPSTVIASAPKGADSGRTESVEVVPADASVAEAVSIRDDLGRLVKVPARVDRVVSLSPALTESVCALDACGHLVGVDRYSNWPASVQKLPKLGSLNGFNIEAVTALRPDLVLAPNDPHLLTSLQRLGLKVLVLMPERYADIAGVLQRVGQVLGLPAERAENRWQSIEAGMSELAASMPTAAQRLRTYVEVDPTPYVAGPDSFIGEMLQRLSLKNVVGERGRAFLPISREWVLQADPDLMMVGDPGRVGLEALKARPGWRRLRALRTGRVCQFSGEALDTMVRPGPRVVEGARRMRDCAVRHVPE